MFKSDPIFSKKKLGTEILEWYIRSSAGDFGPFSSQEKATLQLIDFIKENNNKSSSCFSLIKQAGDLDWDHEKIDTFIL
ncbi:hypothetical protein [Methylomonas sp. AM2-LC]|uniref:hypothetical protein n=1 Tax=Methylomonas sp. AM2-LC TaxID=3153301 RepID=UPI0032671361